ncbi:MAG: tetratricopeptide repeat protein [Thermoproteota archaeon]
MSIKDDAITDPHYYNNKGIVLIHLGKYEEAINEFDKAVRLNPKNPDYHNNKGLALLNLRRYKEAEKEFTKAVRLNWRNPSYRFNKGQALLELKKYGEAINEFNRAVELDPNNPDYYYYKGLALLKLTKYWESKKEFDKATELNPNNLDYQSCRVKATLMTLEKAINKGITGSYYFIISVIPLTIAYTLILAIIDLRDCFESFAGYYDEKRIPEYGLGIFPYATGFLFSIILLIANVAIFILSPKSIFESSFYQEYGNIIGVIFMLYLIGALLLMKCFSILSGKTGKKTFRKAGQLLPADGILKLIGIIPYMSFLPLQPSAASMHIVFLTNLISGPVSLIAWIIIRSTFFKLMPDYQKQVSDTIMKILERLGEEKTPKITLRLGQEESAGVNFHLA